MIIDLSRTFSEHQKSASDEEDWSQYLGLREGSKNWTDLCSYPVVVVLGEAGIGKTIEFQNQVERHRAAGQIAFFIPLNQVADAESWQLVLSGREAEFEMWIASDELAYFFLDAVDESRLKSHADFEKSLAVVHRALAKNFARVRIAISSRITDWSIPEVRLAVDVRLTKPIARALAAKTAISARSTAPESLTVVAPAVNDEPSSEALVVSLDPLSNSEARRCAAAFRLEDEQQFWISVAEGDYEFMATRPLDLRWMVVIWNQRRTLGTYRELIDANIANRLREFNVNYEAAGEVLSSGELYAGAIELAAAAEFGGYAFLALDSGTPPMVGELSPYTVLVGWQPMAIRRLLATAVFDEASFGRVKFHHRSIREFLAAEWVAKQMEAGVPLHRLQGLFVSRPFGHPVLIPARRASLSWLAAISVAAREWVVREHPEILLYEGDAQAWDGLSADLAFANLIEKSKQAFQLSWFLSASEFMRLGRVLSAGKVAQVLADSSMPTTVRSICFKIARHAKLTDCAAVSFIVFRDTGAPAWERATALDVLEFIGTKEHRQAVLAELKSGSLITNELISHAIPVTEWMHLTDAELSGIFNSTQSEASYGTGPMVNVVKRELLIEADMSAALLILRAVMMSLPFTNSGTRFSRFPEENQPERAWLLYVLPNCFKRVLELLPNTGAIWPAICIEAAVRVEALRDSGFTNKDELSRLSEAIARHPDFRWSVALGIAQSADIRASVSRLVWDRSCLVSFSAEDLPELTAKINDVALPVTVRDIWFEVAMAVAFSGGHGRLRSRALRALGLGALGSPRALRVMGQYDSWRAGAKQRRVWNVEERLRQANDELSLGNLRARLYADLESIRNGSGVNLLIELLNFSFNRSGRREYSDVDFHEISSSLAPEIASAFEAGLVACWPTLLPPDPSAYANGAVPWISLIALAGLRGTLLDESSISRLSAMDVTKAAQLAVWELQAPPHWFEMLARLRRPEVEEALVPWLVTEAKAATPGNGVHRTLEMVLRCTQDVRRNLMAHLAPLVASGQISRRETFEAVVPAMRDDGVLQPAVVGAICSSKLEVSAGASGNLGEMVWLRIWMETNPAIAWAWFQAHLQQLSGDVAAEVNTFATVIADLKWLQTPLTSESADVLLSIHALLRAYPTLSIPSDESYDNDFFGSPSKHLCDAIANVFVRTRGRIGHDSLASLMTAIANPVEWRRAAGQLVEHAALDAALSANRTSVQLQSIATPFMTPPSSEAQLYEQVIARLEEIRKNLEEGPFSERDLFSASTPEKFLQRWLAAKFRETQNRRFSVHREEEVDDDKKTDIQLSCPAGNVCVEIKPVDAGRSYSANSLTDTLQTQIVAQYLRGNNSTRGILVLMQLDQKTWEIPGDARGRAFPALVDYLDGQAQSIKRNSADVNELTVFGIRCVICVAQPCRVSLNQKPKNA